ncbi:DUF4250 domain-containing protein [[Clostridium] symbiosum]|uniref:DUF4250 domain-containing protein n=1 Tax=Clostridium symbiosum TaxID=1512 RepID=A0AAW5F076_CLOSY|nr:DUF4250 domain-containing protein [[Clostridium] symbiosum]MCK0084636.1 DUF4250 domain-containing protein [[Clostridium] symbiosum]
MKKIPQDPIICLSYVNTQLRDFYSSLDLLCDDLMINRDELVKKLADAVFLMTESKTDFIDHERQTNDE